MVKKHYRFTVKDFLMLEQKTGKQKKTKLAEYDFTDTVVFKPWGFEYLFMEDKDCCGWMLHINDNYGTSLHCHMTKSTIVCVIDGILALTTAGGRFLMSAGDIVLIDKKVFHAMGAIAGNARVIELEMPSYKPDAVRVVDPWGRKGQPYESLCLLLGLNNPPKNKKRKREKGKEAKP